MSEITTSSITRANAQVTTGVIPPAASAGVSPTLPSLTLVGEVKLPDFEKMVEFSPNVSPTYLQLMEKSFQSALEVCSPRDLESYQQPFDENAAADGLASYFRREKDVRGALAEWRYFHETIKGSLNQFLLLLPKNKENRLKQVAGSLIRLAEKYNLVGVAKDKENFGSGACEYGKAIQIFYSLVEGDYRQSQFMKKPFSGINELRLDENGIIAKFTDYLRKYYSPGKKELRTAFEEYQKALKEVQAVIGQLRGNFKIKVPLNEKLKDFLKRYPANKYPFTKYENGNLIFTEEIGIMEMSDLFNCFPDDEIREAIEVFTGSSKKPVKEPTMGFLRAYTEESKNVLGNLKEKVIALKKARQKFESELKTYPLEALTETQSGSLPEDVLWTGGYSVKKVYSQMAGALKSLGDSYRMRAIAARSRNDMSAVKEFEDNALVLYEKAKEYLETKVEILDPKVLPEKGSAEIEYHDYILDSYLDWADTVIQIAKTKIKKNEKAEAEALLKTVYDKKQEIFNRLTGNYLNHKLVNFLRFVRNFYLTTNLLNQEALKQEKDNYSSILRKFTLADYQEGLREMKNLVQSLIKSGGLTIDASTIKMDLEVNPLRITEPTASQLYHLRKMIIYDLSEEQFLEILQQPKPGKNEAETRLDNFESFVAQKSGRAQIVLENIELADATAKALKFGERNFKDEANGSRIKISTADEAQKKYNVTLTSRLTWSEIITLFSLDYHLGLNNFYFNDLEKKFIRDFSGEGPFWPFWARVEQAYGELHPAFDLNMVNYIDGLERFLNLARSSRDLKLLERLTALKEPLAFSLNYVRNPNVETTATISVKNLVPKQREELIYLMQLFCRQISYLEDFAQGTITLTVRGAMPEDPQKYTTIGEPYKLKEYLRNCFNAERNRPEFGELSDEVKADLQAQRGILEKLFKESTENAQKRNEEFKKQFAEFKTATGIEMPFETTLKLKDRKDINWIYSLLYCAGKGFELFEQRTFSDVLCYSAYRFPMAGIKDREKADLLKRFHDVKYWADFTKLGIEISMVPSSQEEINEIKKAAAGPEGPEKKQALETIAFWQGKAPLVKLQEAVAKFKKFEEDRKTEIDGDQTKGIAADQVKKDRLETLRCWLQLKVFEAAREFEVDKKPKEERDKLLVALALDPNKPNEIAEPPESISKDSKDPSASPDPSRPLDGRYYRTLRALIVTKKLPSDITKCPTDEEIKTAVKNAGLEKKDEDMLIAEYKKNFGKIRPWVVYKLLEKNQQIIKELKKELKEN